MYSRMFIDLRKKTRENVASRCFAGRLHGGSLVVKKAAFFLMGSFGSLASECLLFC